ncbi:HAMP domain-containing protein, partial [bacterium]|nr:HAMP domain-containing protein [bacterium]
NWRNSKRRLLRHFTFRSRIKLAILTALVLIAPMFSVSLHYVNTMWVKVDKIAKLDSRLVDLSHEIELYTLLTKRAEANMILNLVPGNTDMYIQRNQQATETILEFCEEGLTKLAPNDSTLLEIQQLTQDYRDAFNLFLEKWRPVTSKKTQRKILKQSFFTSKNDLLSQYTALLNQAVGAQVETVKDSLLNEADKLFDKSSTTDFPLVSAAQTNPETAPYKESMLVTADQISQLANSLGEKGQHQMQVHLKEVEIHTTRAKRNMITLLLLTFMVAVYLVFVFPEQMIKPIEAITNIIRRAESGDYNITVPYKTSDEIGELAAFLNQLLKQVKEYDDLKTEKIAQQQRKVETMANAVSEGVLILNHALEIMVVNRVLEEKMGWNGDFYGKKIDLLDNQKDLIQTLAAFAGSESNLLEKEFLIPDIQSKPRPWYIRATILRKENKEPFAMICVFTPGIITIKKHENID